MVLATVWLAINHTGATARISKITHIESNNDMCQMSLNSAHVTILPLLLGHYICAGTDPDVGQVDLTDCWFTYNNGSGH